MREFTIIIQGAKIKVSEEKMRQFADEVKRLREQGNRLPFYEALRKPFQGHRIGLIRLTPEIKKELYSQFGQILNLFKREKEEAALIKEVEQAPVIKIKPPALPKTKKQIEKELRVQELAAKKAREAAMLERQENLFK